MRIHVVAFAASIALWSAAASAQIAMTPPSGTGCVQRVFYCPIPAITPG